jgi:hypothetical protein
MHAPDGADDVEGVSHPPKSIAEMASAMPISAVRQW